MNGRSRVVVEQVEPINWSGITTQFSDFGFEQSKTYADSMAQNIRAKTQFFAVYQGSRLIGAACARIRTLPFLDHGVAYISGGPMIRIDGADLDLEKHRLVLDALKTEMVQKRKHHLLIRAPIEAIRRNEMEVNFLDLGFSDTQRARSYRTIFVDVTPDEPQMRSNLAAKWRTDLNYSQKSGLEIEIGTDRSFQTRFMALFGNMVDTKNFDVQVDPRSVFALPAESIGLHILIATKDGEDAAGHVLSLLGDTAVYLFGASNDHGRSAKAGYWMNWQAMKLAHSRGYKWYDMGGIDPESNPGGYRFKKRMGGQDLTAAGPYELRHEGAIGSISEFLLSLRDRIRPR